MALQRRAIAGGLKQPQSNASIGMVVGSLAFVSILVVLIAKWRSGGSGTLEQTLHSYEVFVDTQAGATEDKHRTYLLQNHGGKKQASFWHDIPLPLADARDRRVLPFVNEITVGCVLH